MWLCGCGCCSGYEPGFWLLASGFWLLLHIFLCGCLCGGHGGGGGGGATKYCTTSASACFAATVALIYFNFFLLFSFHFSLLTSHFSFSPNYVFFFSFQIQWEAKVKDANCGMKANILSTDSISLTWDTSASSKYDNHTHQELVAMNSHGWATRFALKK